MEKVIQIGDVPWSREEMLEALAEFCSLYEKRPIKDNEGGMKSPHMFLAWFALRKLKPKAIVESGVWFGQGTWLFEQACPDADLYCIDLFLDQIEYRSGRAKYFDQDFTIIDWSTLPKGETVLFFDDHQNAYERVKTAKWFGFKHMIFEDNYPPTQGDCYSLKKAFMHSGFKMYIGNKKAENRGIINKLQYYLSGKEKNNDFESVPPNDIDAKYLHENLKVYYEFPPPFKTERTRWNDVWDNDVYPTPQPLLDELTDKYQKILHDEAIHYTWMCYVALN